MTQLTNKPVCPKCSSEDTSPDYDKVFWPEHMIDDEVKIENKTPFFCWDCGHEWNGSWRESKQT